MSLADRESQSPGYYRAPKLSCAAGTTTSIFLCVLASIALTRDGGIIVPVWPANALLLVFILQSRPGAAPWYLLFGFVGIFLGNAWAGTPTALTAVFATSNALEIGICLILLRRLVHGPLDFANPWHLGAYAAAAALGPLAPASISALALQALAGADLPDNWLTWYFSDVLGLLIVGPVTSVLVSGAARKLIAPARVNRTVMLFALYAASLLIVFYQASMPLAFLIFPMFIVIAFNLGTEGVAAAVALTAAVATGAELFHSGPIALMSGTMTERLFVLQIFLASTVVSMFPMATAIAERNRLESSLESARREAERANRAKSEFLASMSHELRTPLNAISGFAQLLMSNPLERPTARQKEYLGKVLEADSHLQTLIGEVLDLAKIEAGTIEVKMEDVDCHDAMQNVAAALDSMAREHNVHLSADLESAAGLSVRADRARLAQILHNLASNAIKYNIPNGQAHIRCARMGSAVRFSVTDTGRGIPRARQDGVFEAFNRLGAEQGPIKGTGIGLSIARNLTVAMGGAIGFYSEPGVGSEFWFELASGSLRREPGKGISGDPGLRFAARDKTVLYIEDNPTNADLMTGIFMAFTDARLLIAGTGTQGLAMARKERPDLIIADIHLPDMSGYDVLERLRANKATQAIPVLAVTADATPETAVRSGEAGFDGFLTKPFRIEELIGLMSGHLKAA